MGWVCLINQRDLVKLAGLSASSSELTPSPTSLASEATGGSESIEVSGETDFAVEDFIKVGNERAQIKELDGETGPTYIWGLFDPLQETHASTTSVVKASDVREARSVGLTAGDIALDENSQAAIESTLQKTVNAARTALGI